MSVTSPPSVLGRYRVAELVGRGAFGRVLKVIDAQTAEARALKVSAQGDGMLLDEFAQLARLRHPSLPRVFEVGRTTETIDDVAAGAPFFISEWIAGGRSDARRWDEPHALWSLLVDIAGALAVIHAAGLVHGDVSPANILLVDDAVAGVPDGTDRAMLVDLGLAAATSALGDGARGTPPYMAPEALAGYAEPRSDLYSLGATVVRLVTGRPLFDAPTLGELVQRIVTATAAPPLPMLPPPLADLVGRLVAREPDHRPASALALLDELDQLAAVIAPGQTRRARPKVGAPPAPAAWPGAPAVIEELARGLAGRAAIHVVAGSVAAGAHEIVDAAIRRWQLDEVAHGRLTMSPLRGSLDAVAALLAASPGSVTGSPTGSGDAQGRRWLDAMCRAIARPGGSEAPLVVC
jgi:eukaryotic-like serine/threonine-protein kinase